jgi:hypothetical protein
MPTRPRIRHSAKVRHDATIWDATIWHGACDLDFASPDFISNTGAIMKRLAFACLSACAVLACSAVLWPAAAAPFCMSNQVLKPQCIYFDAQECARDAARQNATCSTNPSELPLTANVGQYCVVVSSRISKCTYFDRQTCDREATQLHGTCTIAPTRIGSGTPDPYSAINGQ